jgi:multidrug transporter EmrE-like cation transporter
MQEKSTGRFLGLTPILLFMLMVIGSGVLTQNFSTMPILVAFAISAGFGLLLNNSTSSLSISKKIDIFCRGGGDKTIILLAMIFY